MTKNKIALIVAGGKGERMQADIPKQFIEILGKPILMYTLEAFAQYDTTTQLVVVLPASQIDFWFDLCRKHEFELTHSVVEGGQTRFHSVKNGLDTIKDSALVAVHDGVRPLVSQETIARCFESASQQGTAIPVVDLVDSIRQLDGDGSRSVDRSAFKLVQTPQVFDGNILQRAYKQEFSSLFTDDASVVEAMGMYVQLVEGNRENIKITTAIDLKIAEMILQSAK